MCTGTAVTKTWIKTLFTLAGVSGNMIESAGLKAVNRGAPFALGAFFSYCQDLVARFSCEQPP